MQAGILLELLDPAQDVPFGFKMLSALASQIEFMPEVQKHQCCRNDGCDHADQRRRHRRCAKVLGRNDVIQLCPAGQHRQRKGTGRRHDAGRDQLAGKVGLFERCKEDRVDREYDDESTDATVGKDCCNQQCTVGCILIAEQLADHLGERRDQQGFFHHLAEQGVGDKDKEVFGNEI